MEAARHLLGIALLLASSAGCQLRTLQPAADAAPDVEIIPDAGVCVDLKKECVSSTVLRDCQMMGQLPADIQCSWGCLDGTPPAHCGLLQPAGGVLSEADLEPDPALLDRSANSPAGEIDGESGSITGLRVAGPNVINGIEFQVRVVGGRNVGVFRVRKLTLLGDWVVKGANAIAIASLDEVVLQGRLDLRGDCNGSNAGPGGFAGGNSATTASGSGGGQGGGGTTDTDGGGGGASGASGGNAGRQGGQRPSGGNAFGNPEITVLVGGGGGGGGGGTGGRGGGGGGAIHIAANGKVTLRLDAVVQPSGINAGGCGGSGSATDGGGGGGAGGTILIEAPEVELDGGHLAVNGGGGGAGNNALASGTGENGRLDVMRAIGGTVIGNGDGGRGGAAGTRTGEQGGDANDAGGGGGGAGRIRINTRVTNGVTVTGNATVSPTFEENGSTSTKSLGAVR